MKTTNNLCNYFSEKIMLLILLVLWSNQSSAQTEDAVTIDKNAVKTGKVTFAYYPSLLESVERVQLVGTMNEFNIDDETSVMMKKEDGSFSIDVDLQPGVYHFKFIINGKWVVDMKSLQGKIKPSNIILENSFDGSKFTVADNGIVDTTVIARSGYYMNKSFDSTSITNVHADADSAIARITWQNAGSGYKKAIHIYAQVDGPTSYYPRYELLKVLPSNAKSAELSLESLTAYSIRICNVSKDGSIDKGKEVFVRMKSNRIIYEEVDKRGVFVYLPPGYSENAAKKYPVVYMLDGQNLFSLRKGSLDKWRVNEVLDSLITNKVLAPVVVVGIFNGSRRTAEYIPYTTMQGGKLFYGEGTSFANWIVTGVVPFIEHKYHVADKREERAVFGNSLGGELSLWMMLHQSKYFSMGATISPAPVQGMISDVGALPKQDVKIWLDGGSNESFSGVSYVESSRSILDVLLRKGYEYEKDIVYYEVPGMTDHREAYIAQRIAYPFIFFAGKKADAVTNVEVSAEKLPAGLSPSTVIINAVATFNNGIKYSLYDKASYSINSSKKIGIDKAGITNANEIPAGTIVGVTYKNSTQKFTINSYK